MAGLVELFNDVISVFSKYNSASDYFLAFGTFLVLSFTMILLSKIIISLLKKASSKTENGIDDAVINFLGGIHWFLYLYLSFYFATLSLEKSEFAEKLIYLFLIVVIIFYIGVALSRVIDFYVHFYIKRRKKAKKEENSSMITVLGVLVKIAVWIVLFLTLLTNFGVEITPMIAGLGVGGVAIALAAQAILSDLFSAFVIYFDKPFKEGDFIIIGTDMGVVKHIGIKTTRIQHLQGQELVISNSEMTNSRINNYMKMPKRRVVFKFGVEYSTTNEQLEMINSIVKKTVKGIKGAELDRVHFSGFGDSSLDYEVVYYVDSSDYNFYMDIQQKINLKLKAALEKEGVNFAFPSRSIYMMDTGNEKKGK